MGVQFVMRITFLLLLTCGLAEAAAPPMAVPGCKDICGNVSIPYPFGMTTAGCYLNDWFRIVCTGNDSSARAFLPSIKMEVLEIKFPNRNFDDDYYSPYEPGIIRVKMPIIISSNCTSTVPRNGSVSMTGGPFYFSSYRNKFISVGCNNMAVMTGIDPMVLVGCNSHCNSETMTDKEAICSGFNCCQTTVPYGIQVLTVTFKSRDEKNSGNKNCKYAFLAEEGWFDSSITNPSYEVPLLEYVPVALEWTVSNFTTINSTEAVKRKASWYYTNYGAWFYSCRYGYEGNPYLNAGCQDINECEKDYTCPNKSDCENTDGSYNCNKANKRKSQLKVAIIESSLSSRTPLSQNQPSPLLSLTKNSHRVFTKELAPCLSIEVRSTTCDKEWSSENIGSTLNIGTQNFYLIGSSSFDSHQPKFHAFIHCFPLPLQ